MQDKTILIIEDEEALLDALAEVFDQENFNTLKAKDGEEGLKLALKEHPSLILLDILLPKLNGIDLLKKLRADKWGKKAEVMLLTNLSDTKDVADALTHGVHNYFVKTDIDIDDVVNKVKARLV